MTLFDNCLGCKLVLYHSTSNRKNLSGLAFQELLNPKLDLYTSTTPGINMLILILIRRILTYKSKCRRFDWSIPKRVKVETMWVRRVRYDRKICDKQTQASFFRFLVRSTLSCKNGNFGNQLCFYFYHFSIKVSAAWSFALMALDVMRPRHVISISGINPFVTFGQH